jgi:cell division protein FtsB
MSEGENKANTKMRYGDEVGKYQWYHLHLSIMSTIYLFIYLFLLLNKLFTVRCLSLET